MNIQTLRKVTLTILLNVYHSNKTTLIKFIGSKNYETFRKISEQICFKFAIHLGVLYFYLLTNKKIKRELKNQQAADIFKKYLKSGKNRITPERFEVMDAALGQEGHFGADDLYIEMKNRKSGVSRATVYKTLELLVQCDLLSKRNFGDHMAHYESSFRRQNHDHLICMDCGRIVEFINAKVKKLPNEISDELGFEVESYSFNIFARCKNIKTCKYYHK